jgi:type II secretory pathway pseudopilin PulG
LSVAGAGFANDPRCLEGAGLLATSRCRAQARSHQGAGDGFRRRFHPAGFTLVELLVALGITLALAGIALAIVVNTLGIWHRVQGDFSGAVQARAVFDLIERDLQGALQRSDAGPWLATELADSATALRDTHGWVVDAPPLGRIKPDGVLSLDAVPVADAFGRGSGIGRARFGLGGAWLRFFSLDRAGMPMAVSYELARCPAGGAGPPHYFLVRATSTDPLARGWDVTAGYDDVLAAPGPSAALADGVVDFGVWLYVRDPTADGGLRRLFPTGATDLARFAPAGRNVASSAVAYPEVADVMVRVLTEEGTELLANLESGRGRIAGATDADWWSLVEAHSTVFVQRVELKGVGR